MAIHPIDLQTLFTQMDKVGKTQVQEKSALIVQRDHQTMEQQKAAEMQARAVSKTPDQEEGLERVKDRRRGQEGEEEADKKKEDKEEGQVEQASKQIRDPNLGQNIDVSG